MKKSNWPAILLLIVMSAGAASAQFSEVLTQVGMIDSHELGDICVPVISSGAAWGDYDNDGDPDQFVANQGGANHLYRNDGDVTLDGLPDFVDEAAAMGVDDIDGNTQGGLFLDYDNDGDQDLLAIAWGGNKLFRNDLIETGSVAFVDVTATAGVANYGRPITAAAADFDDDGLLDIYIAKHGECKDVMPVNSEDVLYHNNGDGTFTDVTDYLCVGAAPCAQTSGLGFAPGWFDFDRDGDVDLYLVNDDIDNIMGANVLWRNDGPDSSGGWLFTDVSAASGTDHSLNGMGLAIGDVDNDGDLDLAFSNVGANVLLINRSDGTFHDASVPSGIERELNPFGDTAITWGTTFLDYDNDGKLDLFFVGGYIAGPPFEQPNALFANNGDGTFTDISALAGIDDNGRGRGAGVTDIDSDGRLDIWVGGYGETPLLFHNESPSGNHWLEVTVEGTSSNRDGIGTQLTLLTSGGSQLQAISSGSTHGGGDLRIAHFGMGSETQGDLVVRWPNNAVESLGTFSADQQIHLVQGSFALEQPVPGTAGVVNTFEVSGATPGNAITLIASDGPGEFATPTCPGVNLSLSSILVLDNQIADGSGLATLSVDVPAGALGSTVYFHVAEAATCTISNRIRTTF